MAIPVIDPAPDNPEVRKQMIVSSEDEQLERMREHALGTMDGLLHGTKPLHRDYAIWSEFVGEIEAEQRKRAED
jgi:hypothetical protein